MINTSHVERGRSLMDPQPHPRGSPRSNLADVHEFLPSGRQKCESHKGNDLRCTEDDEVFPSQISEAYLSPNWQYVDGHYHAKGSFRPSAFQGVLTLWRVAAPSATKKRTIPLCSSVLSSTPIMDERTFHYAHLQNNKETILWTRAFFAMHVSYTTDGSIDTK